LFFSSPAKKEEESLTHMAHIVKASHAHPDTKALPKSAKSSRYYQIPRNGGRNLSPFFRQRNIRVRKK